MSNSKLHSVQLLKKFHAFYVLGNALSSSATCLSSWTVKINSLSIHLSRECGQTQLYKYGY